MFTGNQDHMEFSLITASSLMQIARLSGPYVANENKPLKGTASTRGRALKSMSLSSSSNAHISNNSPAIKKLSSVHSRKEDGLRKRLSALMSENEELRDHCKEWSDIHNTQEEKMKDLARKNQKLQIEVNNLKARLSLSEENLKLFR